MLQGAISDGDSWVQITRLNDFANPKDMSMCIDAFVWGYILMHIESRISETESLSGNAIPSNEVPGKGN